MNDIAPISCKNWFSFTVLRTVSRLTELPFKPTLEEVHPAAPAGVGGGLDSARQLGPQVPGRLGVAALHAVVVDPPHVLVFERVRQTVWGWKIMHLQNSKVQFI